MAHSSSTAAPAMVPERPLWRKFIPSPLRSIGRPIIHAWQRFSYKRQSRANEDRERRSLLDSAVPIIHDVYGYRFVLYPHDRPHLLYFARHAADAAEFKAIPRLVHSGAVAFDIGANVGVYTVLLSRLCGESGRVWAFEPVPETYWRLRETLALNRCENVIPVRAAVCEKDGAATINLFDEAHSEWNSLGVSEMGAPGATMLPTSSVEVLSASLDSFCEREGIRHIDFLKVDVEGFELSVFKGAKRLLGERRIGCICFEISQPPLKGAGVKSGEVFAALEQNEYFAYALDQNTGAFSGPVHDTREQWTNFFASAMDLTKL